MRTFAECTNHRIQGGTMKKLISVAIVACLVVGGIVGTAAIASAQPHDRVSAFVCPVFNPDSMAGVKNPNAFAIAPEGDVAHYSIAPGKAFTHPGGPVMVPLHATNGNGTGSPGGPHSEPGDTDYTAIWAVVPVVPQ
jgi:hypothetical protein